MDEKDFRELLFSITVIIMFVLGLTYYHVIDQRKEFEQTWNNGTCSLCDGKYKLITPLSHDNYTTYWYQCDKCGHGIEINRQMKEVKQDE